jgi:hypothetical protein
VAFVNSELKWQEKHRNVDGLVLAHLHYLKFARVRLWSQRRFPFGLLCFRGSLLLESITTACRLGLLLGLLCLLVLLVDNLHSEHNILWERIVQLNIDLTCLVELGRFIDSIDRISLIDVREELEHHSSSLHVALLLVREDDFA